MRQITLAGKTFSALTFGTDKLGLADETLFFQLADAYLDRGGSSFDTARLYANGESEQLLGRYLMAHGGRERLFIATKGGFPDRKNGGRSRLNQEELTADCAASLAALQLPSVDYYWLHRDDLSLAPGEIIEMMNRLMDRGWFRGFGASNFTVERIAAANDYAFAHHLEPLTASQIQWSAAETDYDRYQDPGIQIMDAKEYAGYEQLQIPVFCFAPLAGGYFNKLEQDPESLPEKLKRRFDCPENRARLPRLKALCQEQGCSLATASLVFLANNRIETSVVTGARKISQLEDCFAAFEQKTAPFGAKFA